MIEPIAKKAPTNRDDCDTRAIGTIHSDSLPIFVHEPVLEQILDYSERDQRKELGGFLIGGLHVEGKHNYVEIRQFLAAVDAESRAASLTFTHNTWSAMNRTVADKFPDDVVLGWHHTHPDFGVFLSAYDLFIHRHFFSEPWQVALVVDPNRQELGFFQWLRDRVVDCGFVCVAEQKVESSQ